MKECLLDADRAPIIHIKTDPISSTKIWTRFIFWIRKNKLLAFVILLVTSFTAIFFNQNSSPTTISLPLLISRFDSTLFHPPHQDKLRASLTNNYLEDTFLDWNRVSNASTKVKSAFVVVTREQEMYKLRATMLDVESHFNHKYGYPWIIIGPNTFSKQFKESIIHTTNSPVSFGLAPAIEWQEPYWIDIRKAEDSAKEFALKDLPKGESMYWRRMTRYNMGFLAFHPLLRDLEFYWKVQPGSNYHCDITHDPFQRMKDENKKLSFALTMTENHEYIKGLDVAVKDFIIRNMDILQPTTKSIYKALVHNPNEALDKNNPLREYAGHYSNCMIYNNFMISSLEFLRSKEYNLFFDELDATGGFFYERWGDSLPQTFAIGLFLKGSDILFDDLIGYSHDSGSICPSNVNSFVDLKCTCNPNDIRVKYMEHCTPRFINAIQGIL